MLTISKALNSAQAQTYHAKEFTSAEQNYWTQGNIVLGEWQGRLAESYGLSGTIDAQHFARLSEGHDPHTDARLLKANTAKEYIGQDGITVKAVEHRAGWDATFSAPKSVSLTALVGGDDRVRQAHQSAVTTALTELERYTQARIGGNNAAETTGKFIVAKFEHDTARPVDGYAAPQLHTHAVIFNLTQRADGSTRALQEHGFFDSRQFATAVYQSELTFQLRNLGYELTTGKSGAPEIAGYTQEYLDASSPRRQQIEQALAKSGFQGHAAAQIAAHNTRDKKQIHTPEQVFAAHKQIAKEFGDQADKVVSLAHATGPRIAPESPQKAQEAVTYAKERSFEREAVTDQRSLLRDALRRGMGDIPYLQIRQNFDQRQATGEFQIVAGLKHSTGQQFTTRETIAAELANIRHLQEGRNAAIPILSNKDATAHAATRDFLNPAQKRAIEQVLTSTDRIHGLQGLAGTGKTTTLEAIREGAEKAGYKIEGFAPTSRAAGQLRDAKIEATTLQGFLAKGQQPVDPNTRHLYMVDETSLASTMQMRDFLNRIAPQDRILLIGDTSQHQGVDAGKPFEQMQQAGMETSLLDQIMRQKDPELLKAVEHLSRNETEIGIDLLQQQGRITEIADPAGRIDAIAKDYAAKPADTLVISPDNKSRQQINQAIRAELQATGAVSKDSHRFAVLTQRSDMTGADRSWAEKYQKGDILQYTKGSKELGIERGSYATVTGIDRTSNQLTVQKDDGKAVSYDPKRLHGISAYREIQRDFAQGDRVQFTGINRALNISNRDLGTVTKIEGKQLTVKMDGEKPREITFDAGKMRHLDHGYAVTSHSSQGLTTNRVLVNMDTTTHSSLINTRFAYVSISRASQDARIYTNDAQGLGQRLSADISKTSAVQPIKPEQARVVESPAKHLTEAPATPAKQTSPTSQQQQPAVAQLTPEERHRAILQTALPKEANQFEWSRTQKDGTESYQHIKSAGWLHISPEGQFRNNNAQTIDKAEALTHAAKAPEQRKSQAMDLGMSI